MSKKTNKKTSNVKQFFTDLINKKSSNSTLKNLFTVPVRDKGKNVPHWRVDTPNTLYQADLLFMPNDDGNKYILNVVDVYDSKVDNRPLKTKTPADIKKALISIFEGKILKKPEMIVFDSGTEFKNALIKEYLKANNIISKYAQTARHRTVAMAEAANKKIGSALHKRMTAQELITGTDSKEWVEDLPILTKVLNTKAHARFPKTKPTDDVVCQDKGCDLLEVGTKVRTQLNHPVSATENQKRLTGNFRSSDIRWSTNPHIITNILLLPNQPPMYELDDNETTLYTKNQLQLMGETEKLPLPKHVVKNKQEIYKVEKILDKRKIGGIIKYLVKWVGYENKKDQTWESRIKLLEDVPDIVKMYEKENKKDKK